MRNIKGEAFISRRSSGMSFDFSHRDERMYIAGTEDGHIYKCSTSYSEQYLETYSGHLGPVYRVQWSPFQSNLFISSSADWSVKLWTEGKVSVHLTECTSLMYPLLAMHLSRRLNSNNSESSVNRKSQISYSNCECTPMSIDVSLLHSEE